MRPMYAANDKPLERTRRNPLLSRPQTKRQGAMIDLELVSRRRVALRLTGDASGSEERERENERMPSSVAENRLQPMGVQLTCYVFRTVLKV